MAERIYARTSEGNLEPLEEEAFSTEGELQRLTAENPHLLDGEQMRPGDARRWILIQREKGIAETSGGSARWSVDHLIIDQDAVPTLVEVKLGSNPEIRRTIVGQMMEYAAHAQQTWTADELRQTFEQSAVAQGSDPEIELAKLLQDDALDVDSFWDDVATNLAASRLRLLFVSDDIPDPLERVVGFLNGQMPGIEVLAVEIKQFRSEQTQTLVPRVMGRIAAQPRHGGTGPRRKLDRESFLAEFNNDKYRSVATSLLDAAEKAGADVAWGSTGFSVRARCSTWPYPVSVAWLFPPTASGWMGLTNISFGEAISDYDPPPNDQLRSLLGRWADQFSGDNFTKKVARKRINVWTSDYDAAAENIEQLADRLARVLSELQSS